MVVIVRRRGSGDGSGGEIPHMVALMILVTYIHSHTPCIGTTQCSLRLRHAAEAVTPLLSALGRNKDEQHTIEMIPSMPLGVRTRGLGDEYKFGNLDDILMLLLVFTVFSK